MAKGFSYLTNLWNRKQLDEQNRMLKELYEGEGIPNGGVDSDKLAEDSVGTKVLQNKSVTTEKLDDYSIKEEKLRQDSVSTRVLQKNAVTEDKIATDSVTDRALMYGQITKGKTRTDAIDLTNTNFYKIVSKNLFDKSKAFSGTINDKGLYIANDIHKASDFIRVGSSKKIVTSHNIQAYIELDENGKPVNYVNGFGAKEFTTTSKTVYIAVSFYYANLDSFMISIDTLPTNYEIFKAEIITEVFPEDIKNPNVDNKNIKNKILDSIKLKDFKLGKNKANKDFLSESCYVDPLTGTVHKDSATYDTFFMLENEYFGIKDVEMICSNARFITVYDEQGMVLKDAGFNLQNIPKDFVFNISKEVKYYSISFKKESIETYQILIGNVMTEYVPPRYQLDNLEINSTNVLSKDEIEDKTIDVDFLKVGQALYSTTGEEETYLFENMFFDKTFPYSYDLHSKLVLENKGLSIDKNATGIYPDTTRVYDNSNVEIIKRVFNCVIRNKTTKKIKVLLIGDSTVRSNGTGEITKYLKQYFGDLIELIGTMGSDGNFFEGRGGWTANAYVNQEKDGTYTNAFWNPTTKKFDFAYYLQQNNLPTPDLVIFQLGINDVFSLKTDESVVLESEKICGHLDYMINNIISYDSSIKVALNIPIGPNKNQARFDEVYKRSQTQQRYERNNNILVREMIKHYDGKIDLIPVHLTIDRNIEIFDGVHPKTEGYVKMAKMVRNYINFLGQ